MDAHRLSRGAFSKALICIAARFGRAYIARSLKTEIFAL
jgi:hypothetical protein